MSPAVNPLLPFRRLVLSRLPYTGVYLKVHQPCELLVYHGGRAIHPNHPLDISMSILAPACCYILRAEVKTAPPMASELLREIERRMEFTDRPVPLHLRTS